jgi:hypothetical protein
MRGRRSEAASRAGIEAVKEAFTAAKRNRQYIGEQGAQAPALVDSS